jgi:hypothetical protein
VSARLPQKLAKTPNGATARPHSSDEETQIEERRALPAHRFRNAVAEPAEIGHGLPEGRIVAGVGLVPFDATLARDLGRQEGARGWGTTCCSSVGARCMLLPRHPETALRDDHALDLVRSRRRSAASAATVYIHWSRPWSGVAGSFRRELPGEPHDLHPDGGKCVFSSVV